MSRRFADCSVAWEEPRMKGEASRERFFHIQRRVASCAEEAFLLLSQSEEQSESFRTVERIERLGKGGNSHASLNRPIHWFYLVGRCSSIVPSRVKVRRHWARVSRDEFLEEFSRLERTTPRRHASYPNRLPRLDKDYSPPGPRQIECRTFLLILVVGLDVGSPWSCWTMCRYCRRFVALQGRIHSERWEENRAFALTSRHQRFAIFDVLRWMFVIVEELPKSTGVQTSRTQAEERSNAQDTDQHGKVKVKTNGDDRNGSEMTHDLNIDRRSVAVLHADRLFTDVKMVSSRSVLLVIAWSKWIMPRKL